MSERSPFSPPGSAFAADRAAATQRKRRQRERQRAGAVAVVTIALDRDAVALLVEAGLVKGSDERPGRVALGAAVEAALRRWAKFEAELASMRTILNGAAGKMSQGDN